MRQTGVRNNLKIAVHPFVLSQVLVVQIIFFSEEHSYGTLALDVSSSMFILHLFSILILLSFMEKTVQNFISWYKLLHSDYFS